MIAWFALIATSARFERMMRWCFTHMHLWHIPTALSLIGAALLFASFWRDRDKRGL
jgi:hypothetical protein